MKNERDISKVVVTVFVCAVLVLLLCYIYADRCLQASGHVAVDDVCS